MVGDELGDGIALITLWAAGDTKTWVHLAGEAARDSRSIEVMGQLTHVAVQLARAIASQAGIDWPVERVIQHFAQTAQRGE